MDRGPCLALYPATTVWWLSGFPALVIWRANQRPGYNLTPTVGKKEFVGAIGSCGRRGPVMCWRLGALVLVTFLLWVGRRYRLFRATGLSMEPVLMDGAVFLVDVAAYRRRLPRDREVVVFRDPRHLDRILVKRVIAGPGERIGSVDGEACIPGRPAPERLSRSERIQAGAPVTVPPGHYVVFGDNPRLSLDSRAWGFLPADHLLGKALLPSPEAASRARRLGHLLQRRVADPWPRSM